MDVNELKPNSHKSKQNEAPPEEKRVKTIVPAEPAKKGGFGNFVKSFVKSDMETIRENIVDEYVKPGIVDIIMGVINMIFYGNTDGGRSKGSSGSSGGYVSYNTKYNSRNNDRGNYGNQHNFDYRELTWQTRGKAEAALNALWEILDEYQMVRIADLFDIAQQTPPGDTTGNDYGWRDLSGSRVVRTFDGRYCLELPNAVSLK